MKSLPKKLEEKLNIRKSTNALRSLPKDTIKKVDFISNDYLGLAKSEILFEKTHQILLANNLKHNGSTGSRLISGNHKLYKDLENQLSQFYDSQDALVYNSGYNANIGLFASVPQRNDIVLFDEFIHASIRDGISMGIAKHFKFKHNSIEDLERKLNKFATQYENIYVVTESVFSMDGDSPDIKKLISSCLKYKARLIIDEAHAVGIMGENFNGLVKAEKCFAKIITFGKALGTHGAAILCKTDLKEYLVNFSRSFIYTTALSPHTIASIKVAHESLDTKKIDSLTSNIKYFKSLTRELNLHDLFISSNSAIQSCIIRGNDNVKTIAIKLMSQGFDVKAILHPTVPKNEERLRFCLHSYNTEKEIYDLLQQLVIFVK